MGYVYPYLACFAFLILWSRLPDPTGPDKVRKLEEPMKLRVSYTQNIGARTADRWTDEFEVHPTQVVYEIGTLLENARDEGHEITKILIERDELHDIGDFRNALDAPCERWSGYGTRGRGAIEPK